MLNQKINFSDEYMSKCENFLKFLKAKNDAIFNLYLQVKKYQDADEWIHDLRVSMRRLKPAIDVLSLKEDQRSKKEILNSIESSLRQYFKQLSNIRDMQVHINFMKSLCFEETYQPFCKKLIDLQNLMILDLEKTMTNWDIEGLHDSLQNVIVEINIKEDYLDTYMNITQSKLQKKLEKAFDEFRRDKTKFHNLRIKIKKYRYFLEMKSEIEEIQLQGKIHLLKKYQDDLGEIQDLECLIKTAKENEASKDLILNVENMKKKKLNKFWEIFSEEVLLSELL